MKPIACYYHACNKLGTRFMFYNRGKETVLVVTCDFCADNEYLPENKRGFVLYNEISKEEFILRKIKETSIFEKNRYNKKIYSNQKG